MAHITFDTEFKQDPLGVELTVHLESEYSKSMVVQLAGSLPLGMACW